MIQSSINKIVISRGKEPYENTLEVLSHFDFSFLKGKKVLLKPNAGRIASYEKGITTHPEVIAGAIDFFRKFGVIAAVGESPISGVNTMEAFDITGIAKIAKERNCPLFDMDADKPIIKEIPNAKVLKSIKLCKKVSEFDFIVSIPVIKTHMHTGVTLSIKNMKGCLWARSKVLLHMFPEIAGFEDKPIDVAIADMSTILKPDFALIDGTICMEGMGPSAGTAKPMNMVIAGFNPFKTDAVACHIMGIDPEKVPHLKLGAQFNRTTLGLEGTEIIPSDWEKYIIQFALPPKDLVLEYPNITVFDKNSCSACQSSLYLFLKQYGTSILEYCQDGKLNIAIGKGHKTLPDNTLCIGNCTSSHKSKCPYIQGCPPVSSEILSLITGSRKFDIKDGTPE
ncbi:MAG TPA: hypothetical protein DD381_01585 [Lentisphaeria bacterium]|nr:MAG: hypothetical protein A2X47_10445 [Lentisphaerae bacterium GWF2_38_69]HBM15033.1 hypothetical protein [Lentisphaeria bacterium]